MNVGELLSLPGLRNELPRVDIALKGAIASDNPFLTEVAGHLILAGGKTLRPSMSIAAALTTVPAPLPASVIQGAAAVELVHLGSMYHDDVLDGAEMRRTVPSVNARWGNFMAIIAGDYLLARASGIAATLGTEITEILASTIAELCEGQVREHQYAYDLSRSVEAYEQCISGKTASLISAAARIGAITSGMQREQVEALSSFGRAFGIAFQIRDDILDITGTDEQLGKPAGNDLVEGVYTLATIYAATEDVAGRELRGLLGRPIDTPERDKARDIIRSSSGVESAIADGRAWAMRAAAALDPLPQSEMASQLRELSEDLFTDLT